MDQRSLPVFSDAAAWWRPAVNLVDPGLDPIRVNTIETSGNLFEVLGVSPQLGTGFAAGGPLFVPDQQTIVGVTSFGNPVCRGPVYYQRVDLPGVLRWVR